MNIAKSPPSVSEVSIRELRGTLHAIDVRVCYLRAGAVLCHEKGAEAAAPCISASVSEPPGCLLSGVFRRNLNNFMGGRQ